MPPAANCRHPAPGWTESWPALVCTACGVRRFPDYAALWWPAQEYRAAGPRPFIGGRRPVPQSFEPVSPMSDR
ncbi:DUF6255 family natural product biosynthesis protein [Streptomyces sp. NPDC021100]|uniref:DUF6255 family natural product biosynthesis protein n=1 Tax=Streptomyces sp. NPDC021100 TaxID=3365114 RepID=UPI0037AE8C45